MLSNDTKATTFAIADTKVYVPVVTLSIQDSSKLSQQLKEGFKTASNWNKSQSKVTLKAPGTFL